MTGEPPRVTVAIPLHRSAPFVDVVVGNIRAIGIEDAEIIVSDRTVLDDTAEQIALATRDDPRVRVVAEPLGWSWTEHHRQLLDEARGRYFLLMPHDDDFPDGCVEALVERLDADPGAIGAFGDLAWIGQPGRRSPPPPVALDRPLRAVDAARLLTYWTIATAYRAVLRRDAVLRDGVRLRDLPDDGAWSDDLFVLELALAGRLVHLPEVVSYKRDHPASTHARWRAGPWPTLRWHARAIALLVSRRPDRTVPLAVLVVLRRWWAFVVLDLRRRARRRPAGG